MNENWFVLSAKEFMVQTLNKTDTALFVCRKWQGEGVDFPEPGF